MTTDSVLFPEDVAVVEDVLAHHRYARQGFYDDEKGWSFTVWCAGCDWSEHHPDSRDLKLEALHRGHVASVIVQRLRDEKR